MPKYLLSNDLSWTGYMNSISNRKSSDENLNIGGMQDILSINQNFQSVFHHGIPMNYLVDYTTGKYLLMSKSVNMIMGYRPEDFIDNGVDFTIEKYHKDDLRLFNNEIFPERLSILKTIPAEEHNKYIFSYNYRLKNKQEEYFNVLQRNCFIRSDRNGNPLMSLGMVININHYKCENPVIHTVDKLNDNIDGLAKTIFKKAFYIREEDKLLTKREKEILLWIAEGLTSKQIANKLNISENTVINHSRNMQDKINSPNITALVSFAIRNGII